MAPMSWNGSQIIYNKVVRPVFLRHEATVDNMVSDLGGKAMSAAENLTREGKTGPGPPLGPFTEDLNMYVLPLSLFSLLSPDHSGEE